MGDREREQVLLPNNTMCKNKFFIARMVDVVQDYNNNNNTNDKGNDNDGVAGLRPEQQSNDAPCLLSSKLSVSLQLLCNRDIHSTTYSFSLLSRRLGFQRDI